MMEMGNVEGQDAGKRGKELLDLEYEEVFNVQVGRSSTCIGKKRSPTKKCFAGDFWEDRLTKEGIPENKENEVQNSGPIDVELAAGNNVSTDEIVESLNREEVVEKIASVKMVDTVPLQICLRNKQCSTEFGDTFWVDRQFACRDGIDISKDDERGLIALKVPPDKGYFSDQGGY
ncbi:unnamed protein product [Ilex paraguariensis]|uniref:Uncharacterized protein n=1 Tax=Ilex paraguariensis TaxID=185542 RepID=A0ABC8V4B9_9AQUA